MNQSRLKIKLLAVTLIIGLALGCGFAISIFRSAATTPTPVNTKVDLDQQHSSSAVISPNGGTLSTEGTDGTKFTLTFPKNALNNDVTITLIPIATVNGLPLSGGLVGGVQMVPEGLRLLQPAILTIESPRTVAASGFETVAFAYHQNGEGLYLKSYCQKLCLKDSGGDPILLDSINKFDALDHLRQHI